MTGEMTETAIEHIRSLQRRGYDYKKINEYIRKIIIHAPDKSGGKRRQKVEIFFNFVDDVDIPVISEPIVTQTTYERRKTA